jgi:hypothetical protein
MADDRQHFTQELVSAKYLVEMPESVEPEMPQPVRRAQPPSSGLEQAMRWISPLVLFMLLAAGIGLYFKKEDSIRASVNRFGERTSNPIDLVLWFGGSKQTLREGFESTLQEAQRSAQADLERMQAEQPKFKFDSSDFENAWNPQGDR